MTTLSICWSAVAEIAIALGIALAIVIAIFGTMFLIFSEDKKLRIIGYCIGIIYIIAFFVGLYFFLAQNCQ